MNANHVLYRLSATGSGSWTQFRSAVEDLIGEDEEAGGARDRLPVYQKIRLSLQQLAHVEFDAAECHRGWRVAPATLAISDNGAEPLGIVCGARLPAGEIALRHARDSIRLETANGAHQPDTIRLLSTTEASLEALARDLGLTIQPHATLSILSILPRVTDLQAWNCRPADMPFGKRTKVQRLHIKKGTCAWTEASVKEAKSAGEGLFRFTRFTRPEHYLRINGVAYHVRGQIGNYFLASLKHIPLLRYDRAAQRLTVPDICRPPLLVDRALILRTGFLPMHDRGAGTLTYENIPEGIAGMAASILAQPSL
jgi:hypothetical protein